MVKKITRIITLLLLANLTTLLIYACSFKVSDTSPNINNKPSSNSNCRVVKHTMGEACIPLNPKRVVTLFTTENVLALGIKPIASDSLAGFPIAKYLSSKLKGIKPVGDANQPNIEKILRLKPDLILSTSRFQGIYKQLSYIAPTVVLNVPFPPPSWEQQLENVAKALDKEEISQHLINQYWQRIEKIKLALGERRHMIKVSIANTSSEYGIWAYGEKHFSSSVLEDIGLQRPESQKKDLFYINNISKEKVFELDGDVLFFVSWEREDDKKTLEKLKQSPLWKQLNVIQRNQAYVVGAHWHNSDVFAINAILDDIEKYLVNTP